MLYLICAVLVLSVIVLTSLFVERLKRKVAIFLGIGATTVGGLWVFGGEQEHHVLHHVYIVDYPQFIMVPLATVLIACLALFAVRVKDGVGVAWFMLLLCPLAGNFATTWSLVPIGLSLTPVLKRLYPDRWFRILLAVCIFSMNMLALGTLAADPPQALWAVKAAVAGKPLGFFFPWMQFWPYILITWALYGVTLARFGVRFHSPLRELAGIRPAQWWKAGYGIAIAACVSYAITFLVGYQVTIFLGIVCLIVALSSLCFDHHARHATMHWCTETVTIFIAFFAVVALAHSGLHHIHVGNQAMIPGVIGMTLGADNAAAFAAAYPQYEELDQVYMVWFNLFNSVVYGGLSPLGNGPQIALFLIVLVSLRTVTAKEVFVTWIREAAAFGPYLLVWTLGMSTLIEFGFKPTVAVQLLLGLIAFAVCLQFMDIQRLFRAHVDDPENGRS